MIWYIFAICILYIYVKKYLLYLKGDESFSYLDQTGTIEYIFCLSSMNLLFISIKLALLNSYFVYQKISNVITSVFPAYELRRMYFFTKENSLFI